MSMLLLVLTAVLAKVLAPLVQSSRNNHSVPNPLCSVCCAGDFLMQKFIDDLIQALYPAAELFLLLWYRAFALFYTLYGTLTHFTERLQGTAKNVQFFTQTIRLRKAGNRMTIQNLLQQCRKKSHSKVLRFWVVLAAVALLLVLACRGYDWDALGRYKGDNISSLHYVRGRVVEVLRDDTKPDQLDPARSMGTQELRILLLEGANKGTEVTIANYLTRTQNVRLRQGETAIICEDLPDSADAYYTVYNYDRAPVLVLILAVFAAAVVAIGGWKGVRTLLGLGFTGAMIAWLILPGIYHGLPSLPLTVAALAVCTLVSLLLLNPPSPKTWAAMLSTLAGVALAGGVFYLFSTLLHLSGMNDTNGEGLVLVAGQTGLELHWLLLVAVLISSLGAVMDVALSLASSLHELREADGKMSGLQLFAAGMRIGRDMIGTMSNTLILAFAGEAVTTLLLLMAYGWHSSQLFASDYAAIQVAQGVASTLGVVLGVPITSGICAALYRPLKR